MDSLVMVLLEYVHDLLALDGTSPLLKTRLLLEMPLVVKIAEVWWAFTDFLLKVRMDSGDDLCA